MIQIHTRMNKIGIVLLLIVMNTMLSAQDELIDRVVARVGTEYILMSDVEEQFNYAKISNPALSEDARCTILRDIISQKAIIYQAILDSVVVTDEEVQTQLDLRFDYTLRQMNGDEEFFKEYYGATVNEMKERYRDDQRQQILAERMQQKLITEVKITPAEVKQFFNGIPKDSLPYLDSEVELGEIVLKPIISTSAKEAAKAKLTDIRQQIIDGDITFEEMALKHSQDPGSGQRGGDLGFAKRGTYVPEFEATVYRLDKDQISEVIETEFGYHIIKMIERRGNNIRAKHILIKPEVSEADIEATKQKLDSIRTLITQDSMSFGAAVAKFSEKSSDSYNNAGRMRNPQNGSYLFQTDELDPDVYFEVIDLKLNEMTDPKPFTSRGGEQQFRIIQLQSLTKPHQANLRQDYDKIAKLAKENKKAEYFNAWLSEKMKEIYITVDDQYAECKKELEF